MRFSCPECGAAYHLPAKHRLAKNGGELECYICQHTFEVEGEPKPKPAPPRKASKPRKKRAARKGKRTAAKQNNRRPADAVVTGIQPEPDFPEPTEAEKSAGTDRPAKPDRPDSGYPAGDRLLTAPARPKKPTHGLAWPLGALILAVALVANTLWQVRTHPPIHDALTGLCVKLGCQIPLLRDPDAIRISERLFSRVPDRPDILVMRMRFANSAPFPQPYPGVELVLYDGIQAVIGRGRVLAGDYLPAEAPDRLEPGELVEIELNMMDPDQLATGFEIAFF